ncbi:MAG: hypothetical protein JWM05_2317 [Acidimicrobiales bacterium]|nr:hypothetical protein [Acidimicrobiales bacterium]
MDRLTSLTRQQQIIGGVVVVVGLVLGGVVVATAGGDGSQKAAPATTRAARTSTTAATTTARPTTTAKPRPTVPVAPLTGLKVTGYPLLRPALAVKIDNLDTPAEGAVPQRGLNRADVVFEEIVEGNITRLIGVFHSQATDPVGPVRSARTTDVHLLPQLRHPLVAWSGGNGGVTAAIRGADVMDVGAGAVPGAYFRDGSRRPPHNLYVHPDQLWALAPPNAPGPTPLFSYLPDGKVPSWYPASGVDLTWGGGGASSPVSWRWDPGTKQYLRSQRGRPHIDAESGQPLSATNLVVLTTAYGEDGNRSPEALAVGTGEALVFSGGTVTNGTWSRPDERSPAHLIGPDGKGIKLMPGRTWVELPKAGGATVTH